MASSQRNWVDIISCVFIAFRTSDWVSGSVFGTLTSNVSVGSVSRSDSRIIHSTGTLRRRFCPPPLPLSSGASDAFSLYTAVMFTNASAGSPVH